MRGKWVDLLDYFGPDRRRRPGSKRWGDRRRDDEAGELPPLGALLRRVRVQMHSAHADDRRRALQLLNAAIDEAQRLGYRGCSEALQGVDRILRQRGDAAALAAAAEGQLVEAMDHAAAQR
jgi:hypothetical protein